MKIYYGTAVFSRFNAGPQLKSGLYIRWVKTSNFKINVNVGGVCSRPRRLIKVTPEVEALDRGQEAVELTSKHVLLSRTARHSILVLYTYCYFGIFS